MKRQYPRRLAVGTLSAVLALGIVACSTDAQREELSADDGFKRIAAANCQDLVTLEGDPLSPSSARGFHCFDEGDGVAFRWYSQEDGALKVLPDWEALVSSERQLVYTDHWFAIGAADTLIEVFQGYDYEGPTQELPAPVSMTPREQNVVLCSSIAYNLLIDSSLEDEDQPKSQDQYFTEYAGMNDLVSGIASRAQGAIQDERPLRDPFRMEALFTKYDDEIKGYCERFAE